MLEAAPSQHREQQTAFLIAGSGVLMQQGPDQPWRTVTLSPLSAHPGPTAAQLRMLRREAARQAHPAGSAHRSCPRPQPTSERGTAFEIFNPLTEHWAPVPDGGPARVADALCWLLPDGRLLVGGLTSTTFSTYDPATHQWSTAQARHAEGTSSGRPAAGTTSVIAIRLIT